MHSGKRGHGAAIGRRFLREHRHQEALFPLEVRSKEGLQGEQVAANLGQEFNGYSLVQPVLVAPNTRTDRSDLSVIEA